jgi:hypothetical protein
MRAAVRAVVLIGFASVVTVGAAPSGDRGSLWPGLATECQGGLADQPGRPYRFPDHAVVVETFNGSRPLPASMDGTEDERVPCVELK